MTNAMEPSEEQFFQEGDEASPEPPEERPHPVDPPQVSPGSGLPASARRALLRRVVGTALLSGVALFGAGLLRHYVAPQSQLGASKPERQATFSAMLPAKTTTAATPTTAVPNATSPVASASASSGLSDPQPSSERAPSAADAALIRRARSLLEAGHTRDGVAVARSAISANPKNAEPYILLAAGLQDLGKWAEAQAVFATCKQATSSGPNATCRYFAGQ